jgi:putative ABC transport system permease protein
VEAIFAKAQAPNQIPRAIAEIRDLLRQRHRLHPDQEDDFTVRKHAEAFAAQEEATTTMALLLGALASISLLVGGIGIMNIMLVSVTERTREIGIRAAVGAKSREILAQFLVEATTLSSIGGLLGIVLGVGTARLIALVAGWPILISLKAILVAFLFSAGIGIFFGYYPARKAAQLNPIEALRYE